MAKKTEEALVIVINAETMKSPERAQATIVAIENDPHAEIQVTRTPNWCDDVLKVVEKHLGRVRVTDALANC